LVAHCAAALLRNHMADLIFARALFWHHAAGLPAHRTGVLFWNHLANFVVAATLFRHHVANLVAHCAAALFWNHFADLIATGPLLAGHVANFVAFGAGASFALVLRAANLLLDAFRDPMLAAARPRRALNAFSVAFAWAVAATA